MPGAQPAPQRCDSRPLPDIEQGYPIGDVRVEHDRHATSHLTSGELILETLCDWRAAERLLFDRPLTPAEFETVRLACVDLRLAYGRLAEMTSDEGSNEYRRLVDGARRAIDLVSTRYP